MLHHVHFWGCNNVPEAYIAPMEKLQSWMTANGETDVSLALKLKINGRPISRVQVLRIRKGETGASKETAQALESITGIPWPEFIGPPVVQSAGAAA